MTSEGKHPLKVGENGHETHQEFLSPAGRIVVTISFGGPINFSEIYLCVVYCLCLKMFVSNLSHNYGDDPECLKIIFSNDCRVREQCRRNK